MKTQTTLARLFRVIVEEASQNPHFESALAAALDTAGKGEPRKEKLIGQDDPSSEGKRGKHRRAPALIDPVQMAREGEPALRTALETLSLDQLRDIVAEFGMDPGKLVMKWVATERIIDRIVEMSITRAHKGSAFRKPADTPTSGDGGLPPSPDATGNSVTPETE